MCEFLKLYHLILTQNQKYGARYKTKIHLYAQLITIFYKICIKTNLCFKFKVYSVIEQGVKNAINNKYN